MGGWVLGALDSVFTHVVKLDERADHAGAESALLV